MVTKELNSRKVLQTLIDRFNMESEGAGYHLRYWGVTNSAYMKCSAAASELKEAIEKLFVEGKDYVVEFINETNGERTFEYRRMRVLEGEEK